MLFISAMKNSAKFIVVALVPMHAYAWEAMGDFALMLFGPFMALGLIIAIAITGASIIAIWRGVKGTSRNYSEEIIKVTIEEDISTDAPVGYVPVPIPKTPPPQKKSALPIIFLASGLCILLAVIYANNTLGDSPIASQILLGGAEFGIMVFVAVLPFLLALIAIAYLIIMVIKR